MTRRCTSCGTPIFYVKTKARLNQALDVKPDPKGNIAVVHGIAVPLSEVQKEHYKGPVYMPHAARHGKGEAPKQTGLVAITGLSVVDEVDRLARLLLRHASKIVKRDADYNDCRAAWPYFLVANPGIPKDTQGMVAPRVREILAEKAKVA
jgi:hypothetical protein